MDVELFSNVLSEEDTIEVDADYDNYLGDEGERCGICMDVVIDRGVLDCCQHWFCFVCIDNWATITNLCPLCQNEFQLITCVPVFDTVGSGKNDEDSDLRDDDWCVEGNNNTLSFPSYYIDENAVTCLDGDGCKIRSGSVPYEETSTLDTSIACDSCDIWYHAFCVGFDPEGTGVETWLCPRCLTNEGDQKSNFKETDPHQLIETSSGKVSICVADTGETALVVSMVHSEDVVNKPNVDSLSDLKFTDNHEVDRSSLDIYCLSDMRKPLDQGINGVQLEKMVPSSTPRETETGIKSELDDTESRPSLDLGQSLVSNLSDDKANDLLCHNESLHDASLDKNLEDMKADNISRLDSKRKRQGSSVQTSEKSEHHESIPSAPLSTKKVKLQQGTSSTSNGNLSLKKKKKPLDIMSIVKGTELKTPNKNVHQKEATKSTKVEKNPIGLRVKKIIRRPSENEDSNSVVQKLKKEIREVVQKNPSGRDIGQSIFDPNLLAAFRAAISSSSTEPAKKVSSVIKAKKLMLQKGKTRENLTKKIYANSSGKRRRAWDRDCQIEFWKHRCMRTSKPEKVETLRSVLNLLNMSPEARIAEQTSKEENEAPILSRLYLADTSLFPRKDDIKPLSVLKANNLDNNEGPSQSNIASIDEKKKNVIIGAKNGVDSGKILESGQNDKASTQKKISEKTNDVKLDKRKWALEILARKTASNSTSSTNQNRDDSSLKGNYPLLAELPTDMRPKLANSRHKKIPISVRQAQLYRLTEHFLKMTNLPSIHRTAATELAVADAINIEKQIADRSHSKVVYLNLCSQEICNHTNFVTPDFPSETSLSNPVPIPEPEPPKVEPNSVNSLDSEAEEALRAAGLLSDSPPSSPTRMVKVKHHDDNDNENDDDNLSEKVNEEKEETKSIFEIDGQPEVDIYGDFEYDLNEDDYIGAALVNTSNSQVEEGESKVKVVFSTLNSVKSDNIPEEKKSHDFPEHDTQKSSPSLLESPKEIPESKEGDLIPLSGENEELSVVECEELYGPEKEPKNLQVLSDLVNVDNSDLLSVNNSEISNDASKVNDDALHRNLGENRSNSSELKRKDKDEKSNKPKIDKKSELGESVVKKVEAYIKEHIRPLCKSGVITVEQYRWAVGKTSEKVMKYHSKAKNANFLIKEGEKVKKLAEQYIETAKHKQNK